MSQNLPHLPTSVKHQEEKKRIIRYNTDFTEVTGCPLAALVLSQITYWYGNDKYGKPRRKIKYLGQLQLAKSHEELGRECKLSARQIRYYLGKLRTLGIIHTEIHKFKGVPTTYIYLHQEELSRRLVQIKCPQSGTEENYQTVRPFRQSRFDNERQTITETTAYNTYPLTPICMGEEVSKEETQNCFAPDPALLVSSQPSHQSETDENSSVFCIGRHTNFPPPSRREAEPRENSSSSFSPSSQTRDNTSEVAQNDSYGPRSGTEGKAAQRTPDSRPPSPTAELRQVIQRPSQMGETSVLLSDECTCKCHSKPRRRKYGTNLRSQGNSPRQVAKKREEEARRKKDDDLQAYLDYDPREKSDPERVARAARNLKFIAEEASRRARKGLPPLTEAESNFILYAENVELVIKQLMEGGISQ